MVSRSAKWGFPLFTGQGNQNPAKADNRVWSRLRQNKSGMTGLILVLIFFCIAVSVAMGYLGQDWSVADGGRWESSSSRYWLGTNLLGQDIFQRSIYSVKVAFNLGFIVALLSTGLGMISGALAGWMSDKWADNVIVFLTGVLDSIPFYLFVAAMAFALRGNEWSMHIAMVATFWTTTSRLIRAEVMRLKEREFVQSAMAMGLPGYQIISRHILPNTFHILLVQMAIVFVAAIKAEVILSFLGMGVQDGVSWGFMLAESTQEVGAGQFNNFFAASIPLFLLLFGFNLMADALQDAYDPRQVTP